MASVRFLLRQVTEQPQTIYVSSRFGRNDKLMYATPLKCELQFWDEERQRVKNSKYCNYANEVNAAIAAIASLLNTTITDAARTGAPVTKDSLREVLDAHFKKSTSANEFHAFFEYYINLCDTRTNRKRGGQNLGPRTKYGYQRTYDIIKEYEASRRTRLSFETLGEDFYEDFVGYLYTLNLSTNSVGNTIAFVKAVLEAAYKRGVNTNVKYKFWHRPSEEGDAVALDEAELKALAEYDFSDAPILERIRDLFLVGCWTGLRFSDVTRLQEDNVGERMISIRQKKTDNVVVIPIHPEFRRIWVKYGGCLPRVPSLQRFNIGIKEVCKEVGLNSHVLKSITKGGRRITKSCEKWEMIASHTARRSFATNLYKSGFPSISIMQITGHKTETAFLRYIKVSPEAHAELLAKHWAK